MAVKTCGREKAHHKRTHGPLSDEIALRDEILELKRQVVRLKRTNEQNLVKFRKYEDEAKRKDRQIEQLMDPRKNADVTKILSTKGAAILMNLKDQNNSLVQVILNKDLQIRKLVSEIKMSKLYASSRKNEPFRTEVNRLRNLLVRSQELLKENLDQHQSICNDGNPLLDISSPSDQSSPRDFDELRCTIQSLETHIKYSNELLTKKNEQISILTNELNALRKFFQCKETRKRSKKVSDWGCDEFFDIHDFSTSQWEGRLFPRPTTGQQVLELFEKSNNRPIPNSAPTNSTEWIPSEESVPKHGSLSNISWKKGTRAEAGETEEAAAPNPLVNDGDAAEILKAGNMISGTVKPGAREKWRKALVKYKQFKAQNSGNVGAREEGKLCWRKVMRKNDPSSDVSDLETHEFEMMEKEIQNDQADSESSRKITRSDAELKETQNTKENSPAVEITQNGQVSTSGTCQIPGGISDTGENGQAVTYEETESDEIQRFKREIDGSTPGFSPEIQRELVNLYQNVSAHQEVEMKRAPTLRETYRQSVDSSFESEQSFSMQEVRVEVEINSPPDDSARDAPTAPENGQRETGGNSAEYDFEGDDDDDDDVVVG